jgi:AraC-like DNA-binding protein
MAELFAGDTRITGRWWNEPFESHVCGMQEHVIVTRYAGVAQATARIDGKLLADPWVPASITLAPRGHDGQWRVSGAVHTSNVFLGHARLQGCAEQVAAGREPELIDRLNFVDPKVFAIMNLLAQEAETREPVQRLFVEQLLDLLCLQLLRAHSSLAVPVPHHLRRGLPAWQVRRVTGYMRERLAEDICLQELADVVNLSRFHFCTAFREATGHTPHEWLTKERLALARTLLADPTLTVTEVATAVGYQTPSAFTATFRRCIGVTPTAFRHGL